MGVINGRAKKFDGTAIDYVSVFNWIDGKCVTQIVPDATGAWKYRYFRNINIGITYVSDGCEPITHGPYNLVVSNHKFWRVTNIVNRTQRYLYGHVAELRFNTASGVKSNNPDRGRIESTYGASDNIINEHKKPFDGNSLTAAYGQLNRLSAWWVSYEFEEAEAVFSVSVQMRQDMQDDYGLEWQTADIEYSDDGITWVKCGRIEPRIGVMNKSMVTTLIVASD